MTDKERDDELIAEAAEMFPPDTVDVQSRYVIVHQLRASADIQDAQTKRETRWADTSDRACLMRKAADTLDALLHKLQPAPKPDRAEELERLRGALRDVGVAWDSAPTVAGLLDGRAAKWFFDTLAPAMIAARKALNEQAARAALGER